MTDFHGDTHRECVTHHACDCIQERLRKAEARVEELEGANNKRRDALHIYIRRVPGFRAFNGTLDSAIGAVGSQLAIKQSQLEAANAERARAEDAFEGVVGQERELRTELRKAEQFQREQYAMAESAEAELRECRWVLGHLKPLLRPTSAARHAVEQVLARQALSSTAPCETEEEEE